MPPLPSDLRSNLERTVVAARDTAETAARASLIALAVERDAPFPSMSEQQRRLRRGLRAKARQLGGGSFADGVPLLIDEIAYQQWHRMLFTRFLAENGLLMHPAGVAVTLAECAELAQEAWPEPGRREGAADAWELAARYASAMLPGLFPVDEPAVQVRFAREHMQALERLLDGLEAEVFTSDDGLGWVYQFWQSKRKDEVNRSERKIGGADLYPVTQLFTEDYMVKFLLHNSLGAWWAARHPGSPLVQQFEYLRWLDEAESGEREEGSGAVVPPVAPRSTLHAPRVPAAGTFPGWPATVAEVTMMDPCGGSGHFEVAALGMFVPMRMEEEGLSEEQAVRAVLRDNLYMLDIDPRCCQIAAFNVLLAAWKRIGYRDDLPVPNIACSGIAVEGQLSDWLRLAGEDIRLQTSLTRLHSLFQDAPTLGSLINPAVVPVQDRLFSADYQDVAPLIEEAMIAEGDRHDLAVAVPGDAVRGVLRAARLLATQYTLVATNVPYLGFKKQDDALREFCDTYFPDSRVDLATVFIERSLSFVMDGGACALVTPQNWLFLKSYVRLRNKVLREQSLNQVAWLGAGAFETISGEVVKPVLVLFSNGSQSVAAQSNQMSLLDVSPISPTAQKANALRTQSLNIASQKDQADNPDARITYRQNKKGALLSDYATCSSGMLTGDGNRFYRYFWECPVLQPEWEYLQNTVRESAAYDGRTQIVYWQQGKGELYRLAESLKHLNHVVQNWQRGQDTWGKSGVAVSQMGQLPITLYMGDRYDCNNAVVTPSDARHLLAIWQFCQSPDFANSIRDIDRSLKVTTTTLLKVHFDLDYWQTVAEERYPAGLPEPWSNDPTQWLFNGHPVGSTEPLHVAVARLLGYRWPENGEDDGLVTLADKDGIVCLSAVVGEQPAAERLRALLAHAYSHPPTLPDFERYRVGDYVPTTPVPPDAGWSPATQRQLLAHAGYADATLDDWLRDGFFEQHVKLFKNRPFIWHVWDGRRDGFHALVNYHKLDAALLDKLIYTYLGAWISDQRAERDTGVAGADGRLVAALELQKKLVAIREGEPPYDIYVRWKPLAEQPVGWNPDLNDGVRLNIRPWVMAGVLRRKFTINWNKDRGKNPDGSERLNDLHFTRAQKLAIR